MNLQKLELNLMAYVNEVGLNNGGSQGTSNSEFGVIDNLPEGWSIVGPGGTTVDYGRVVEHEGRWKFELTNSLDHEGASENVPAQKPTMLVKDAQGVEHEIPIDVTVRDDNAVIRGSSALTANGGDDVSSRLTVTYGADGPHADTPFVVQGAEPTQINGDIAVYELEHGTLEFNTATYAYVFTANSLGASEDGAQQSITFVAMDGDGGSAERTVVINITKPELPVMTLTSSVDEAGIDQNGTEGATDKEFGALSGLPEGWSIVGPGDSVSYGQFELKDGVWVFKLTEAVTHDVPGKGETTEPAEQPTLLIQDALGNTYEVPVTVTVADDAPSLTGDTTLAVKGGSSIESDVQAVYGADGAAPGSSISLAGLTPDSIEGDMATYTTHMGVLTLNTLTGEYSFAANQLPSGTENATEILTFSVTDADGDVTELAVEIGISPDAPPAWLRLSSNVRESGLDGGQLEHMDLEFGALAGLPTGWSVVGPGSIVDYGRVVQKDGAWVFELTKALDHSEQGNGVTLYPDEVPSVVVQDAYGNQYEVPLKISVVDDNPEVFSVADEYIARYQSDLSPKTASGALELTFGADGPAAQKSIEWDIEALGYMTSKGQPIVFSQEDGVLTATVQGRPVFTLSLQPDGSYSYTQYGHMDATQDLAFNLTLRDTDGDEQYVTDVLIVHIDTDVSDEPEIVDPAEDDRFVFFTDGSAETIDGKTIIGDVMRNDNDPEAMILSVTSGTFGNAVLDESGNVRYTLHPDAASRMPGGTDPVYDQLTYTAVDRNGNEYTRTIQIVINRVNVSDDIYNADNQIDGETWVSHISIEGDFMKQTPEIMGSNGDDRFTVNGSIGFATINMGEGNNTVNIQPGAEAEFAFKRSNLFMESGNDDLTIAGLIDTAVINMGQGNNLFTASSSADSTTTMSNSQLIMGDDADRVRITNTVSEKELSPASSVSHYSVKMLGLPTETSGGTLDKNTSIDMGAGNNHIEIIVNPGLNNASIANHSSNDERWQVYDDPYSAMNNGSSIISRSQDNEFTTILIDSSDHGVVNNSHIYVLGGNADITVKTDRETNNLHGGALKVSLYNGSSIETSDGQDTINISSTGYALYKDSHILTGNGDKQITLHSKSTETVMRDGSSVQTGSGNDTISLSTSTKGGEVVFHRGVAKYDTDTYALLMDDSFIDAGAGNNIISLSSTMPLVIDAIHGNTPNTRYLWSGGPRSAFLSSYAINDNSGIKAGMGTWDAQQVTVSNTSSAMGNGSYITTGAGNDTISVTAGGVKGGHVKYALFNESYIDAGNGRNNITVASEDWGLSGTTVLNPDGSYANGNNYSGGSRILSGTGNDTISVTTDGRSGSAIAYSSFINAGEGNNEISVVNKSATGNSGIIYNSGILAGNGNNIINITSYVQALHDHSYIRLGNGDNAITLNGTAFNATYAVMSDTSQIRTGSGDDTITITGPGNGIRNSTIMAGDGDNSINVTATQGTALYEVAKIITGSGADAIIISGATGVASNSEITTDGGNDTVSITATAQQALHSAKLNTGDGSDQIILEAAQTAAYASTLVTGAGDDSITVTSLNLHGFDQSSLDTGIGNDAVTITAANAAGSASGIIASGLTLGDGHDTVTISVTGKNAQGMSSNETASTITMGSGNDVLEITATGTEYGSALTAGRMDNVINAGDGDDYVLLRGSHYALDATSTGYNEILLGNGNDTFAFEGFIQGSADRNLIDGGIGGEDEIRLLLDGTTEEYIAMLNGLTLNATVTNVENIVLDLFGRSEDPLELSQENLNNLYKSAWSDASTPGDSADIYIYGTDYETLDLTGTDGTWQQSGTAVYDGVTYNQWMSDSNEALFVAQGIIVLTS